MVKSRENVAVTNTFVISLLSTINPLTVNFDKDNVKQIVTKKNSIILIIAMLIIALAVFLPSQLNDHNYSITNAELFSAVPVDAAMILEWKNYNTLKSKLSTKVYNNELSELLFAKQIIADFKTFDKLFYQNESNQNFIKTGKTLAATQVSQAKTSDFLYIIRNEDIEIDLVNVYQKWLATAGKAKDFVSENRSIFEFEITQNEKVAACFTNDLLLISKHTFLIEKAILQLDNTNNNIPSNPDFKKIRNKTGQNTDFSIYLNFIALRTYLSQFIKQAYFETLQNFANKGTWAGLDITLLENDFDINGYFSTNPKNRFLKALKQEKLPDNISIAKILPDNIAFSMNFNSRNIKKFIANKKAATTFFNTYFENWLGESITYVISEPTDNQLDKFQFWIAEVKDYELAIEQLDKLADENGHLETINFPPHQFKNIILDNLFEPVFGKDFLPVRNPYYVIINKKYIIFANDVAALKKVTEKIDFQQTLSQSINYQEFTQNMSQVSNLYIYMNLANTFQVLNQVLNNKTATALKPNFTVLAKLKPIAIQLTPYEDLLVINMKANFDAKGKQPTSVIWRKELDAAAIIPPKMVKNHDDNSSELIVQDATNKLYLLSTQGEILWTRQLAGKILSEITQIDYYDNGKLQFLFNTTNQIHLIDRNGENVDNFPRKLAAKATNGLTVLDYDGKKNYRIFVACADGNIYGFLKRGEPLNGWSPQANIGIVKQPIEHFIVDNKDYLVALNDTGLLYVFQRDGEQRIAPTNLNLQEQLIYSKLYFDDLDTNAKRVVVMDIKGKAYVSNLRGDYFNLDMKIGSDKDVRFCMVDLIGTKRKDYIVLSEQNLRLNYYEQDGKFRHKLSKKLPVSQDDIFEIRLNGKPFLGTSSTENNQIFLLNKNFKIIQDFPLAGSTKFEITDFFNDGKNILTVANENMIYAYRLSYLD